MFAWGVEGIKAHGCSGFADYVQELIRNDKKDRHRIFKRSIQPLTVNFNGSASTETRAAAMIERVAGTTISIDDNILPRRRETSHRHARAAARAGVTQASCLNKKRQAGRLYY